MKSRKHLNSKKRKTRRRPPLKLQKGGDLAYIKDVDNINLFTDEDMEKYMNPIYGCIMCNTGYISNNFYLHEIKAINTRESQIIQKMCNVIPGTIQPKIDIQREMTAKDIGNYIAIKYIAMKHPGFIEDISPRKSKYMIKYKRNNKSLEILYPFNMKLNRFIPILTDNEEIYFHLILFCLWWRAQNDDGLKEYYQGIYEAFEFINQLKTEIQYTLTDILNRSKSKSPHSKSPHSKSPHSKSPHSKSSDSKFETIINKLFNPKFVVYNQQTSKNFCVESKHKTYADCGETTMRNLINILCFDGKIFDIELLQKFNPIEPLKEFYKKFNTFEKQSHNDYASYNSDKLNARDEWSKLIIQHGNHNVRFQSQCENTNNGYDLDTGNSLDKSRPNFFQLLQNLLPGVTNWYDLHSKNITHISDNTENGIGTMNITHEIIGNVTLHFQEVHYYVTIVNNKKEPPISYKDLNDRQIDIIKLIKDDIDFLISGNYTNNRVESPTHNNSKKLNEDNYLHYTFLPSEKLEAAINYTTRKKNESLHKKLIVLSFTNKFDDDLRRRISIDADLINIGELFTYSSNISKLNAYSYIGSNFEFVNELPGLTHLTFKLKTDPKTIDLSPLRNIEFIGEGFLNGLKNLESIDLSPLTNVKYIYGNFLSSTESLKTIDLSPLKNLESFGRSFFENSNGLEIIESCDLPKLKEFGIGFFNDSKKLHTIKSISLGNLVSIGDNFFSGCHNLKSIDLSSLKNVKVIENNFLAYTSKLESVDMSHLINLETILDDFLSASGVKHVNLNSLEKLSYIEDKFLYKTEKLVSLDLTLFKVTSLGTKSLDGLKSLKTINLNMPELIDIDNYFLQNAENLETVDLSSMKNLKVIRDKFLNNALKLRSINLSGLHNLEVIGYHFMNNNPKLESINLNSLTSLKSIRSNFLNGCVSLKTVDISKLNNLYEFPTYSYLEKTEAKIIFLPSQRDMVYVPKYESEEEEESEENP
jgi:hypothetical protein